MDSLKAMLLAVSDVRVQAAYMRDVADDLAASLITLDRGTGYDAPISLCDEDLGYDFREVYMPGHPAADERGYVSAEDFTAYVPALAPETQVAYEAQLDAVRQAVERELGECGEAEGDGAADELQALFS